MFNLLFKFNWNYYNLKFSSNLYVEIQEINMKYKAPRGTHDHLPKDENIWSYVQSIATETAKMFGFSQISTPMFEDTGLFKRAVGEETDVVQKEMYNFKDLGGNELTLRPEGTASVCRSFIEHGMHNEPYPLRLFYLEPMFRHERPQSGRLRQHHQFGVEIFGASGPETDIEIITLGLTYLSNLGIKNLNLKVNSIGSVESREKFKKAFTEYIKPNLMQLNEIDQKKFKLNPIRILDSKDKNLKGLIKNSPKPIEFLDDESKNHWDNFIDLLEPIVSNFKGITYELDPDLVRGLDYYSKTVFEIEPTNSGLAQSSILSGGRYDSLIESIGGPKTPAAGFGSGIERIILNIKESNNKNNIGPKLMIVPLSKNALNKSLEIAFKIRDKKISTIVGSTDKSIKAQLRYANQISAENVIILGDKEIQNGSGSIKNFITGKELDIQLNEDSILEAIGINNG